MIDLRDISSELVCNSTPTADGAGVTGNSDDRSTVIASTAAPCSDTGNPCIHVEERGGRETGHDNRDDQIRAMGNRIWVCLDDSCVRPPLGLSIRETTSGEGSDRPLCLHDVPVIRAPDRGARCHVSSALITPVHLSGADTATPTCRATKQLDDIMRWCAIVDTFMRDLVPAFCLALEMRNSRLRLL